MTGESWSGNKHQVPEIVLFGFGGGHFPKVDIVRDGVDKGEKDDAPGNGFVKGNGLIKGHDPVQRRGSQP